MALEDGCAYIVGATFRTAWNGSAPYGMARDDTPSHSEHGFRYRRAGRLTTAGKSGIQQAFAARLHHRDLKPLQKENTFPRYISKMFKDTFREVYISAT